MAPARRRRFAETWDRRLNGKGLLPRLLAVGVFVLLVLAAGEAAVRLMPGRGGFVDTAVQDRPGSALHAPDFRGRPIPRRKQRGRFRVLTIGDSFAWGHGVHAADAWPPRLERRLAAARPGLEVEVVSWSRNGWNTEQAWKSVQPRLRSLRADLVVLGFTLNDAEPTNMESRRRLVEPLARRAPAGAVSRSLHARSAFYRLFWERLENSRQRRAYSEYYQGLFQGESWRACRDAMAELDAAAAELGAPLLVVVFPVFDSQLGDAYSYRPLHDKVTGAARGLEIAVLDLLAAFQGIDARRLALTPFTDPHPSELAHRIAADAIAAHLVGEGLVPAATGDDGPGKAGVGG